MNLYETDVARLDDLRREKAALQVAGADTAHVDPAINRLERLLEIDRLEREQMAWALGMLRP